MITLTLRQSGARAGGRVRAGWTVLAEVATTIRTLHSPAPPRPGHNSETALASDSVPSLSVHYNCSPSLMKTVRVGSVRSDSLFCCDRGLAPSLAAAAMADGGGRGVRDEPTEAQPARAPSIYARLGDGRGGDDDDDDDDDDVDEGGLCSDDEEAARGGKADDADDADEEAAILSAFASREPADADRRPPEIAAATRPAAPARACASGTGGTSSRTGRSPPSASPRSRRSSSPSTPRRGATSITCRRAASSTGDYLGISNVIRNLGI